MPRLPCPRMRGAALQHGNEPRGGLPLLSQAGDRSMPAIRSGVLDSGDSTRDFKRMTAAVGRVHTRLVHDPAVPPAALRLVEGDVGSFDPFLDRGRVLRHERNPDADTDLDVAGIHAKGTGETLE